MGHLGGLIKYIKHELVDTFYRGDVIRLLEEGDKYKKVLEEIEERLIPGKIVEYDIRTNVAHLGALDLIKLIIEDVKQKYFPKILKKTITVEIEAKDIDVLANSMKTISNVISDIKNQMRNLGN